MDNKKRPLWSKLAQQAIFSNPYFWTGVGIIAMVAWTWLKGWFASPYAPLTIPVFLIITGLTFYVSNQIRNYRRGRQVNYEDLIMKWLFQYGHAVQTDPQDNALWQIKVISGEKTIPIRIAIFRQDPEFITIGALGTLSPEDKKHLAELTEKSESTLIQDLRIEMSRFGMEFAGISHPLSKVYLTYKLPLDETLTKLTFFQGFLKVRQAWVLYDNTVVRYRRTVRS